MFLNSYYSDSIYINTAMIGSLKYKNAKKRQKLEKKKGVARIQSIFKWNFVKQERIIEIIRILRPFFQVTKFTITKRKQNRCILSTTTKKRRKKK